MKKETFLLLTSEEGMKHRSQRPIEPEAAFGQMKEDMHYRRDSGISERTLLRSFVIDKTRKVKFLYNIIRFPL